MGKEVTDVNEQKGNVDVFKKRLKKERINAGFISQEAFADKANISKGAISYYEKGTRKPLIDAFINIADALNVSYDYLLGYSKTPIRENHDTRELTGLSDEAIKLLNNLVKESNIEMGFPKLAINKLKTINYLLEQEENFGFLDRLSDFLWNEYKTEYAEGRDVVMAEDISGVQHLFSLTDLDNMNILELQRLLNKLRENTKSDNAKKK